MSNDTYILTTKDFSILEALCDNWQGRNDRLVALCRRKIQKAIVVFRDDLPGDVASINSRVRFRAHAVESDIRVISTGQATGPVGLFLPITTPRGLALLGLRAGQKIEFENTNGVAETMLLEAVEYQPEASRRERQMIGQEVVTSLQRPNLRLVSGGKDGCHSQLIDASGGFDDPGPSAA